MASGRERVFIGVDPGLNGALAALSAQGQLLNAIMIPRGVKWLDEVAIRDWFTQWRDAEVAIENVHSMPGQGVASTFKFGLAAGFLRGVVRGLNLPYTLISPRVWQKPFDLPKGKENLTARKNMLMDLANAKWPGAIRLRRDRDIADALFIANHLRGTRLGL